MPGTLYVKVGDQDYISISDIVNPLQIREDDKVAFCLIKSGISLLPIFYIEDYKLNLKEGVYSEANLPCYYSDQSDYFKESFGYSLARIEYGDDEILIPFEVQIKEVNAKRAQDMLKYISRQKFDILKSCFSRTTMGVSMMQSNETEPEALLSQSEKIIQNLQMHKHELFQRLRHRLIQSSVPSWKVVETNIQIDPYYVISNLDSLMHTTSVSGNVFLKGRHFEFDSAEIISTQPSYNVIENQVLLGGLYSVRKKIKNLYDSLFSIDILKAKSFYGYESFDRLMLELTSDGMLKRCEKILLSCEQFIRILERKYRVTYSGDIKPNITPYVRGSKIYRKIFSLLSGWYQLGVPNLEGVNFLMKLKSISKLYEIFSMIKIIEYFIKNDWIIEDATSHEELGYSVPSYVKFSNKSVFIEIFYEKKIYSFDINSSLNQDLVDTYHNSSSKMPYWNPDFLIKLTVSDKIRYLVLDAKYSSAFTVRRYSLDSIYKKYYEGMAVYDKDNGLLTNNSIISVIAVYAIENSESRYISYWSNKGIMSRVPKLPAIGGVSLTAKDSASFDNVLNELVDISLRV